VRKLVKWAILCSTIAMESRAEVEFMKFGYGGDIWTGTLVDPSDSEQEWDWDVLVDKFDGSPPLAVQMQTIYSYLRRTSYSKRETQLLENGMPAECIFLSDRLNTIENHILMLCTRNVENRNDGDPLRPIAFSYFTASTIYSYAVLRELPLSVLIIGDLIGRLKVGLETVDMSYALQHCASQTLWVLVVGSLASMDRPEQPWFIKQLAIWCRLLGIGTDEAVDLVFREMCWPEALTGVPWKRHRERLADMLEGLE